MSTGEDHQGWAGAHRKLTAALATATAIVGLATAVLTLRDQILPGEEGQPAARAAAAPAALTSATAGKLSDDVQLGRFEELLGPPQDRRRLHNDEWLVSSWDSPDIAVRAFSNRDDQVVAYTLTSLSSEYTPLVEHLRGGIRLRESVFADVPDPPSGVGGIFPPSGRFHYQELHRGGGATAGESVVLAASFAANADDRAAPKLLAGADCLPFSVFEAATGCPPERLEPIRAGLRVTSMTVGELPALEALAVDGAAFHPEADSGT